jgi:hypothetical protein
MGPKLANDDEVPDRIEFGEIEPRALFSSHEHNFSIFKICI